MRELASASPSTAASPAILRNCSRITGRYSASGRRASTTGWLRRERSLRASSVVEGHGDLQAFGAYGTGFSVPGFYPDLSSVGREVRADLVRTLGIRGNRLGRVVDRGLGVRHSARLQKRVLGQARVHLLPGRHARAAAHAGQKPRAVRQPANHGWSRRVMTRMTRAATVVRGPADGTRLLASVRGRAGVSTGEQVYARLPEDAFLEAR